MSRRDHLIHRKLNYALEELSTAFSNNRSSRDAINYLRAERALNLSNQKSLVCDMKEKEMAVTKIENEMDEEVGLTLQAERIMVRTRSFSQSKINRLQREWNEMSRLLEVSIYNT